ncbi:hypothetical protein LOTGIDRAFT_158615 [Lottia gigantea]|uniref:Uncharacterized protein n=1 Tax=Lottia gigantea TaxID=225164 RepID=V4B0D6_LOTGI|nr:hypothetical protein LOTGIDRAFT_158615 [Lottia gigantea]ESO99526.1 hypothetical protein LOTGIDRAFT_158615 [Lottia gigantea]
MSGQGQSQDIQEPTSVENAQIDESVDDKITALRNQMKQLRGKLTRSISRVQTNIRKGETDSKRLKRELKQIVRDNEQCSFVHGEIYELTDPIDHGRLDQWEAELNNDFFIIDEIINEQLKPIADDSSTPSHDSESSQQSPNGKIQSLPTPSRDHQVPVESNKSSQQSQSLSQSVDETSDHLSESGRVVSEIKSDVKVKVKTVDSWIDELIEFEETVHKDINANLSMSQLSRAIVKFRTNGTTPMYIKGLRVFQQITDNLTKPNQTNDYHSTTNQQEIP